MAKIAGGRKISMKSDKEYKELTIREFSKAADIYETDRSGIYEMCKED
ncbi:MAG: hypothetical protein K6E53_03150 [Lachnospiraceae bacterium]|nr:hypothetical protein [Lachnospiraceae bacterium]